MAKKDLVRLLARLYGDPVQQARFRKDRAALLKGARSLAPKEKKLLLDGDPDAVRAYLGKEATKAIIVDSEIAHIVDSALAIIVDDALATDTTTAKAKKTKKPK